MNSLKTGVIFSVVVGIILAITASGFGLQGPIVIVIGVVGGVLSLIVFFRILKSRE